MVDVMRCMCIPTPAASSRHLLYECLLWMTQLVPGEVTADQAELIWHLLLTKTYRGNSQFIQAELAMR